MNDLLIIYLGGAITHVFIYMIALNDEQNGLDANLGVLIANILLWPLVLLWILWIVMTGRAR